MISCIIPVKEPEPYLPQLVGQLEHLLEPPYEILIQRQKGLGYAVMCGIKRSKGDVVVIMDADGSHTPSAVMSLVKLARYKYDIVVGSRYGGGATQDSFRRKLISRVYCLFAQVVFGLSVRDNMSGFIAAKREVFEQYPITNKGFKFGLELLYRSKGKLRATEFPILFASRKAGKSKASPMEAVNTLLFMFRLYRNSKR
jgi:dolichol-phosphate mannosyltransferase